jgi:lysophospholipase L1-like esterase
MKIVLRSFVWILLTTPLLAGPKTVAPDDPAIKIMGRFDGSNPKALSFDWPAVNIRVVVKGPSLTFLLEDIQGTNYFNLSVDGKPVSVVDLAAGLNRIEVPKLGKGPSLVVLSKRTEGFQGPVVFKGLELGTGTSLEGPPVLPTRKIEVIGDSWSCGYGNEGVTHGNCPNLQAVSNADLAFPVVLANSLKAQYHVTAVSGRGILRNYGDARQVSSDNMPIDFGRVLFSKPDTKWDCSRFVPDVVVLRLGVNDHSTQPAPEEADFVKAYAAFLERLRTCYPKAEIFCYGDEGWPGYRPRILMAIEARKAKGEKKVHWVGNRGFSPAELGCDWHPSVKADKELAEQLEKEIRPVMGWNDSAAPAPPAPTPTAAPAEIPPPPEN